MTTQHTPAPWELVPPGKWRIGSGYGVQARTPDGPGWPTPSATGYYAICEPPPHGADKKREQEANARLIAAAPELLASGMSYDLYEEIRSVLRGGALATEFDNWYAEHAVAIAKASNEPLPVSATPLY